MVLPQLQVDADVINDITNAVAAGKEVTVAKTNITYYGWNGCGYIVFDTDTGGGAYIISGGLNGGYWSDSMSCTDKQIAISLITTLFVAVGIIGGVGGAVFAGAIGGFLAALIVYGDAWTINDSMNSALTGFLSGAIGGEFSMLLKGGMLMHWFKAAIIGSLFSSGIDMMMLAGDPVFDSPNNCP